MLRKIYLHIGTEKTGSKTIQRFLHAQKSELLKEGMYVITDEGRLNVRSIPFLFQDLNLVDDYFYEHFGTDTEAATTHRQYIKQKLVETFRRHEDCDYIISAEHFHSRLTSLGCIKSLTDFLRTYFDEVHVTMVFRRPSEMAPSYYSTLLKKGYFITKKEFLTERLVPEYFDVPGIYSRWSCHADSVNVLWFDNIKKNLLSGLSFLPVRLLRAVDVQKTENRALGFIGTYVLLAFNYIFPLRYSGYNYMKWNVVRKIRALIIIISVNLEKPHRCDFSSNTIAKFDDRYFQLRHDLHR